MASFIVLFAIRDRSSRSEPIETALPKVAAPPTTPSQAVGSDSRGTIETSPARHYVSEISDSRTRTSAKQRSRPGPIFRNNPQLAKLHFQYEIRRRLASLYHRLNLTTDQIGVLEDTLTSVEGDSFFNLSSAEQFYREDPNPTTARVLAHTQEALRERVVGVLGNQVGDEFLLSLKTESLQKVVDSLAADSFSARDTFRPQQSRVLFEILRGSSKTDLSKPVATASDIDWAQVLRESQALLTPRQYSVLTEMAAKGQFDAHFYRVTGTETPPFSMIW